MTRLMSLCIAHDFAAFRIRKVHSTVALHNKEPKLFSWRKSPGRFLDFVACFCRD